MERNRFNIFNIITIKFKKYIENFCNKESIEVLEKEEKVHPEFNDVEEEKIDNQCNICFINKKIIAGKCGHLCVCGNCSKQIFEKFEPLCPMCREKWEDVRVIFV